MPNLYWLIHLLVSLMPFQVSDSRTFCFMPYHFQVTFRYFLRCSPREMAWWAQNGQNSQRYMIIYHMILWNLLHRCHLCVQARIPVCDGFYWTSCMGGIDISTFLGITVPFFTPYPRHPQEFWPLTYFLEHHSYSITSTLPYLCKMLSIYTLPTEKNGVGRKGNVLTWLENRGQSNQLERLNNFHMPKAVEKEDSVRTKILLCEVT